MSNRVELISTTFVDATDQETHGFQMFDNYEAAVGHMFAEAVKDDLELLRRVIAENMSETEGLLECAREDGMLINNTWYDPKELSPFFSTPAIEGDKQDEPAATEADPQPKPYWENHSECFWRGHREGFQNIGAAAHSADMLEQQEYLKGYTHGLRMRLGVEAVAAKHGLKGDTKFAVVAAMAIEPFIAANR